jgi:hypothetical protein
MFGAGMPSSYSATVQTKANCFDPAAAGNWRPLRSFVVRRGESWISDGKSPFATGFCRLLDGNHRPLRSFPVRCGKSGIPDGKSVSATGFRCSLSEIGKI